MWNRKLKRIRNEIIRGTTKVGGIPEKVKERGLKGYGRMKRREESYVRKGSGGCDGGKKQMNNNNYYYYKSIYIAPWFQVTLFKGAVQRR